MPVTVTREDILSVKADAAVMSVEIALNVSDGASCRRIDEAGGEALRASIRKQRFLPVGSSAVAEAGELPFRHVLFTAAPRLSHLNFILCMSHSFHLPRGVVPRPFLRTSHPPISPLQCCNFCAKRHAFNP